MPALENLYRKFKNDGFVVLGVGYREVGSAGNQRAFAEARGITYPLVAGRYMNDAPDFVRQVSIPQSYLIDRKGRLVGMVQGPKAWELPTVTSLLGALLSEDYGSEPSSPAASAERH
jgi:peroxiredoxin